MILKPKKNWKKGTEKANASRSEKSKQELEEAFNILSENNEPVDVMVVADYLEIARSAIYARVKKHDKFMIADGQITKKSTNESVISK